MTRTQPITDFYPLVMPDLPGCPAPLIRQSILKVCREFFHETQAWAWDVDAISIRADIDLYNLDGQPRCAEIHTIIQAKLNGRILSAESEYTFDDEEKALVLTTAPSSASSKALEVRVALIPSRDADDIGRVVFGRYADVLADGIKWDLMVKPGKTWSNAPLAAYHKSRYDQGKANARIEINRGVGINTRLVAKPRWSWA